MILGIVTTILFLVECGFGLWKKVGKGKVSPNVLRKFHCVVGILTAVSACVHFVLSIGLWRQRPLLIYLTGILALLCIVTVGCLAIKPMDRKRLKLHKVFTFLIAVCLVVHVYSGISSLIKYQNAVRQIEVSDMAVEDVPDGVYQGECNVGYIYARVQVHVKDGEVTEIELLEHGNERGAAAEKIIDDILESQSLEVDAITSATNSSNVIKKAIENAFESAH